MPNFWNTWARWVPTVRREMNRRSPIWRLVRPSAASRMTPSSLPVRLPNPSTASARARSFGDERPRPAALPPPGRLRVVHRSVGRSRGRPPRPAQLRRRARPAQCRRCPHRPGQAPWSVAAGGTSVLRPATWLDRRRQGPGNSGCLAALGAVGYLVSHDCRSPPVARRDRQADEVGSQEPVGQAETQGVASSQASSSSARA